MIGIGIVKNNREMPYPRICAHRGFNTVAPESSMPAFGEAIALGAEEIEMDLWQTLDGVIVCSHDVGLERVSNGTGDLKDHTYEQLLKLDFGSKYGLEFCGLQIVTFEQVLQKFAGHVIMNLHLRHENQDEVFRAGYITRIVNLIRKYDNQDYCYFMTSWMSTLAQLRRLAPEIPCCVGDGEGLYADQMLEKAIRIGAEKIQLFSPHFEKYSQELQQDYVSYIVKKAHENGVICNLCIADEPELTRQYLEKGVDTLLTNCCQITMTLRDQFLKNK